VQKDRRPGAPRHRRLADSRAPKLAPSRADPRRFSGGTRRVLHSLRRYYPERRSGTLRSRQAWSRNPCHRDGSLHARRGSLDAPGASVPPGHQQNAPHRRHASGAPAICPRLIKCVLHGSGPTTTDTRRFERDGLHSIEIRGNQTLPPPAATPPRCGGDAVRENAPSCHAGFSRNHNGCPQVGLALTRRRDLRRIGQKGFDVRAGPVAERRGRRRGPASSGASHHPLTQRLLPFPGHAGPSRASATRARRRGRRSGGFSRGCRAALTPVPAEPGRQGGCSGAQGRRTRGSGWSATVRPRRELRRGSAAPRGALSHCIGQQPVPRAVRTMQSARDCGSRCTDSKRPLIQSVPYAARVVLLAARPECSQGNGWLSSRRGGGRL